MCLSSDNKEKHKEYLRLSANNFIRHSRLFHTYLCFLYVTCRMRIDELEKSSGMVRWRDAGNPRETGQALQITFHPLFMVNDPACPAQGGERTAVDLGRAGAVVGQEEID